MFLITLEVQAFYLHLSVEKKNTQNIFLIISSISYIFLIISSNIGTEFWF